MCAGVFEHTFARIPGAVKVYFPSGPGAGIVAALTTVTVVRATNKDVRYFMGRLFKEGVKGPNTG